jgi:hypothetical protein
MKDEASQYSFSDDPSLSRALFDLLDKVFPGVPRVAENARVLGAPWESVSTPFIRFEGGQPVSHVGVIELSLILMGRRKKVGSIHGVATHPGFRRQGYYGEAIRAALEYCAGRYETLILTTEHPEYFEPFGFRKVQEYLFQFTCETRKGKDELRQLDPHNESDIVLLHRLLETRTPVSNVVGVVDEKGVFCFNEGSRPLLYSAELDVVVCIELENSTLRVFDIVGPKLPRLSELLDRIPHSIEHISICFSPELLDVNAEASPWLFDHDGPSYLMVRGPFDSEGTQFSLPRSART